MNAFEILGLETSANIAKVKARWRELASTHHPDHGGDATTFHAMRQAYQEALRLSTLPSQCSACSGSGRVIRINGFSSVSMPCGYCYGIGKIPRE